MVENNRLNPEKNDLEIIDQFVRSLSQEHKMLVVLKRQLYDGAWADMLEDLNNRLDGKPYVFKLINRINDDIERINELKQFETDHDVDLTNFVKI